MANPRIEAQPDLDVAIALQTIKKRDALWRDARGNRIHLSDVLSGATVLLLLAAAALDLSHASVPLALASLLALGGYATHTSRQLKAMCALLEISNVPPSV